MVGGVGGQVNESPEVGGISNDWCCNIAIAVTSQQEAALVEAPDS
jgi:hypothetical protein